jgi:hypothetical protein
MICADSVRLKIAMRNAVAHLDREGMAYRVRFSDAIIEFPDAGGSMKFIVTGDSEKIQGLEFSRLEFGATELSPEAQAFFMSRVR